MTNYTDESVKVIMLANEISDEEGISYEDALNEVYSRYETLPEGSVLDYAGLSEEDYDEEDYNEDYDSDYDYEYEDNEYEDDEYEDVEYEDDEYEDDEYEDDEYEDDEYED